MKKIFISSLIILCAIASWQDVNSGEIRVHPRPLNGPFNLEVSVKDAPHSGSTSISPNDENIYVFSFDEGNFGNSAYKEYIITMEWDPKEDDEPVMGVESYAVEIPIILRRWRLADSYNIYAWSFSGIGNRYLTRYERMHNSGDQWQKFFASLQQVAHYTHRIRPNVPEAKRAFHSAIEALKRIAGESEIYWIKPPHGIEERIDDTFGRIDTDRRRAAILKSIHNIRSLIWHDLNNIENNLAHISCDQFYATFADLERWRREDEISYRLQVSPDSRLMENKKILVQNRVCGT